MVQAGLALILEECTCILISKNLKEMLEYWLEQTLLKAKYKDGIIG